LTHNPLFSRVEPECGHPELIDYPPGHWTR
jgi:hypothetical protein